jgi:hypothetical protein
MENKITKKNYFEAIIAMVEAGSLDITAVNADITPEMAMEWATNEIALLDKKAEKAKVYASKKAAASDDLVDIIKSCLTADYQTITDITTKATAINADITSSKVTYRLSKLVEAGVVTKKEVVVDGAEGKTRKLQGYAIA